MVHATPAALKICLYVFWMFSLSGLGTSGMIKTRFPRSLLTSTGGPGAVQVGIALSAATFEATCASRPDEPPDELAAGLPLAHAAIETDSAAAAAARPALTNPPRRTPAPIGSAPPSAHAQEAVSPTQATAEQCPRTCADATSMPCWKFNRGCWGPWGGGVGDGLGGWVHAQRAATGRRSATRRGPHPGRACAASSRTPRGS